MKEEDRNRLCDIEARMHDWHFPPQVVIELTSLCNFKCVHCNHKDLKRQKGIMDENLFYKLINEIVDIEPETEIWPTFYGEAFILGDKLFERLRYAADRGAKNLVLNSNGSLLHRKDWIDKILLSGLKRFIVSLDGFTPETFESIRVGGKRDEIFASIEKLLRRKNELAMEYPIVQCQFSLMDKNADEFPPFKKYWEERGAEVKSRNMLSWTNSGPVVAPNLDYDSDFRIACPWGLNTMAIHYNGDVVACAVDYEGRFIAGNASSQSLVDIWQGPHKERLREKHVSHEWKEIPAICKTCPDWQTAGATYHGGKNSNPKKYARPFWFRDNESSN